MATPAAVSRHMPYVVRGKGWGKKGGRRREGGEGQNMGGGEVGGGGQRSKLCAACF